MRTTSVIAALALSLGALTACNGGRSGASGTTASAADSAFTTLARAIIDDHMVRHPSAATDLGVHTWDSTLEDVSQAAIHAESRAFAEFRARLVSMDTTDLSAANRADRALLIRTMDAGILSDNVIRQWSKDADAYSSTITNAAFTLIKRNFAPPADRLRSLIARERRMPGVLAAAHANLDNPPEVYTRIAIEQIDGDISFFRHDVPAAFPDVQDRTLLATFRRTNDSVIAALTAYKSWVQRDVLPRSHGTFAWGADTYAKALAANEMVDLPLDSLLRIAEADRRKNEAAFQAAARQIDSTRTAEQVLQSLQAEHPAPDRLLAVTQATLDSLREFLVDHHIITVPPGDVARVAETPPFMRAVTEASMDTPGPFETAHLPGRYNMTLPDPRWPAAEQEQYMRSWYPAAISNVSTHEVYPGHYIQFLYAHQFPSDVRRVFGATTNIEGWAHYGEQMTLDEGLHNGDPQYRLAQLQDALLRDVRFIVGIEMHTQGLSIDSAKQLFIAEGHQPPPVAEAEAKRGTSDALYGYYTMGKLMILKLRADYQAKMGAAYSLQGFHDAFIKLGPLPLPLMRQAMLGSVGNLF